MANYNSFNKAKDKGKIGEETVKHLLELNGFKVSDVSTNSTYFHCGDLIAEKDNKQVFVYLDILDFSLSLQATISFQIAVKRGGRITCRLTCLLDCSYKLRETVWIGFSLANKGISPMDKTASRTSLWRS